LQQVLGLSLSIYNVLLLPLDVANQGGEFNAAGPIPMATVELAFLLTTCAMGIAVAPFAMFYYEGVDPSDDDDDDGGKKASTSSQIFYGLKWTFLTLILFFSSRLCAVVFCWAGGTHRQHFPNDIHYNITRSCHRDEYSRVLWDESGTKIPICQIS